MPPILALTQRVSDVAAYRERRDALDQRWFALLEQAGCLPLLLPNRPGMALQLMTQAAPAGLILTGGNSLVSCGGDAPERDETEHRLLSWAIGRRLPVWGICRGMQLILSHFGQQLTPVEGHVCQRQELLIDGELQTVNSYHTWGCYEVPDSFSVVARASDGVIKAIRHRELPIQAVMWHPERLNPFRPADIDALKAGFA